MTPFHLHDPRLLKAAGLCLLLALFVLSLIVIAGCASSRSGKALNIGVGIAGAADVVTTHSGLGVGQ